MTPEISVVMPVYNERENLEPLLRDLETVLQGTEWRYEILCIDDRSTDGSREQLLQLQAHRPWLRVLQLRRHAGQTAALAAGFDQALGRTIVTMDADRQNDPRDIPRLVHTLDLGYDVVSGWRKHRQDSWLRRALSRLANRLLAWSTSIPLYDSGCALKAYRREALRQLVPYGDMHRIFPAYLAALGCRITEVEVQHHPRRAGRSKYGLGRTWQVLLDILAVAFVHRFSHAPIRVLGGVGAVLLGAAVLVGGYVIIRAWRFGGVWMSPLLFVTMTLSIAGLQFIALGLLGEMTLWIQATAPRGRTYMLETPPQTADR